MKRWRARAWLVAVICISLWANYLSGDDQELTDADRLLIEAQQICVVSGQPLDSMGGAIKTQYGDRTLFVCCEECLGKEIPVDIRRQVRANWREAQGESPVMRRALPANAASVVVEGRTVFVCCRPCIPRIEGDPDRYLAIVDELLNENLSEQDGE